MTTIVQNQDLNFLPNLSQLLYRCLINQNPDCNIIMDLHLEEESVYLSQAQICQLFGNDKLTISKDIGNIFKEREMDENSVVRNFRTTERN